MPDTPNTNVPESPLNKNILTLGGIALLIVVMVGFIGSVTFFRSNNTSETPVSTTTTNAAPLPEEVTVTLGTAGFEPNSVTIKKGGAVRWTNTSGEEATVNSDDHPNHQKNKELNLGSFVEGSTLVHIFNTPGTYTYHDHFHPEKTGTVIVQ